MNEYRTIGHEASTDIVVKKSRFLACAWLVDTVERAQEHLAAVKKEHHDASHHCYAYVIGARRQHVKFSDDGEPRGTAGLPILDVLHKKQLTQTLVVVTRYFGGVLLGAGGLARAYGAACAAALDAAGVCIVAPVDEMSVTCPYPVYDSLERFLKRRNVIIKDCAFGADVRIRLLCRSDSTTGLIRDILDLSSGDAVCTVHGQTMAKWPFEPVDV